jgi:hypothetical protein
VLAGISPSRLQPAGMNLGAMLEEIAGVEVGLSIRDGMDLDLSILTKTPKVAEQLRERAAQQLQAVLASRASAQLGDGQATDFLRRVQLSAAGNRLRVKMTMTQAEVDRQIRMMRASAAAPKREMAVRAAPEPRPSPKIRIYGLDDGVREIPLDGAATPPR